MIYNVFLKGKENDNLRSWKTFAIIKWGKKQKCLKQRTLEKFCSGLRKWNRILKKITKSWKK